MTLTFIPIIKLLLFALCILFMYVFAKIAILFKRDYKEPHGCFRRLWIFPIRFLMRVILLLFGFYYIPTTRSVCGQEKARVIVANHIGIVDALYIFVREGCIAACKHDEFNKPIFGTIMKAIQFIPIDRRTHASRSAARHELERRVNDARFPPLLIFPEGTTSNAKAITKFMAGAFSIGLPIQPIVIRYPHCFWDHAMIGNDVWIVWRTMCQLINFQTLEYLPVYKPSDAEIKDPILYANNMQKIFADKTGASMTNHCWDDVRLFSEARKLDAGVNTRDFVADDFKQLAGFTYDHFKIMLPRFKDLDVNKDGSLSIDEFSASPALAKFPEPLRKKLFELIDVNEDGRIDFREFILGFAAASGRVPTKESADIAFNVYDRDHDGLISKQELLDTIISLSTHSDDQDHTAEREQLAKELFPTDTSPSLDREAFNNALQAHPQLISLAFAFDFLRISDKDKEALESKEKPPTNSPVAQETTG